MDRSACDGACIAIARRRRQRQSPRVRCSNQRAPLDGPRLSACFTGASQPLQSDQSGAFRIPVAACVSILLLSDLTGLLCVCAWPSDFESPLRSS